MVVEEEVVEKKKDVKVNRGERGVGHQNKKAPGRAEAGGKGPSQFRIRKKIISTKLDAFGALIRLIWR